MDPPIAVWYRCERHVGGATMYERVDEDNPTTAMSTVERLGRPAYVGKSKAVQLVHPACTSLALILEAVYRACMLPRRTQTHFNICKRTISGSS